VNHRQKIHAIFARVVTKKKC